ncbi:uncharacterized protein LOC62_01G001607 [Vanrija pseudolonga]|uniref:F-box domain-containing protein n=1 Tax=Vanrija pseudolonga TaxID=143232 RepID=A0AAF0Y4R5_9TREE|nr:hypothetical protein LOC62_01G001607 [Vanrija pseudolonga]
MPDERGSTAEPRPPPVLTYTSFPHLVELILQQADLPTLITLRSVSHAIKAKADTWIVQHALASRRSTSPIFTQRNALHHRALLPPYTVVDVVEAMTPNGVNRNTREESTKHKAYLTPVAGAKRHVVVVVLTIPPYPSFNLACRTARNTLMITAEDYALRSADRPCWARLEQIDIVFAPHVVEDMWGAVGEHDAARRDPDPQRTHALSGLAPSVYTEIRPGVFDVIRGRLRTGGGVYCPLFSRLGVFEHVAHGGSVRVVGLDALPPAYVDHSYDPDMGGEGARAAAEGFIEEQFRAWVERRAGRTNIVDEGANVDEVLKTWGLEEEDAAVRRFKVERGTWVVAPSEGVPGEVERAPENDPPRPRGFCM